MGNLVGELTPKQEVAFLREIEGTRNLLAYGLRTIRDGAFLETTREPILTMLSIGVEKLLKLALGCSQLSTTNSWPSKGWMKSQGHGSAEMRASLLGVLDGVEVPISEFVSNLRDQCGGSALQGEIVRVLDTYGRWGRFYYLDRLGGVDQDWEGPEDAWTKIESVALEEGPLARLRDVAFENVQNAEAFEVLLNGISSRIADEIDLLWDLVAYAGMNHLLGRAGEVLGHEVHRSAVGRQ